MSRRLLVLLSIVLLLSSFLVVAEPQEESPSSNPQPRVEVNLKPSGTVVIKLCERKNFTLWINSTESISNVSITINITKGLSYTGRTSDNISKYLNPEPSIINYAKDTIIVWKAKNENENLTRGRYFLVFELEPNAIIDATINATVRYKYMAKQQNATTGSVRITVEKPELSITGINCLVFINQDRVSTIWNVTIRNNEEFNIPDVNVTCEPGSGLSCTNPYRYLNLSKKENKPLQFNVSVTGGLNSLEKGENLIINFTVKCKNCVIKSNTTKVPIVLPALNIDHEGWRANISSTDKNLLLSKVSVVSGNQEIGKNDSIRSKTGNALVPISITNRSTLDTSQNLTLCLEGSVNKIAFKICRLYAIETHELNKMLPYLVIVKGVDKNAEVLVNDGKDYPLLQLHLGEDTILIFLKDIFVPGYNRVKVKVTYLKNGKIFIQIGDYPILGGVGTLAILLSVTLFALVISTRKKVKKIPTRLIEEAPEHIELG